MKYEPTNDRKPQALSAQATPASGSAAEEPRDEAYRHWIFTLPNVICMLRIVGSVCMLVVALLDYRYVFLSLFVILTLSDWIDGRLARWLHQRSEFGARLDSYADAAMYAALFAGVMIFCHEQLESEYIWMAIAGASYALTTGAGFLKYGRVPSYHTFAAKKTQGIVLLAGIVLVLQWATWPFRVAAIAVTLTNLEATLLTWFLPDWQADVSSLWRVLRRRRQERYRNGTPHENDRPDYP